MVARRGGAVSYERGTPVGFRNKGLAKGVSGFQVWSTTSEQSKETFTGFTDFNLRAKGRIWPRLSYMCRIRSTADLTWSAVPPLLGLHPALIGHFYPALIGHFHPDLIGHFHPALIGHFHPALIGHFLTCILSRSVPEWLAIFLSCFMRFVLCEEKPSSRL